MSKVTVTLLGVSQAGKDGLREWRYVVNGLGRVFYTVKAPNADEAMCALQAKLTGNPPTRLPATQLGDDEGDSTGSNVVAVGLLGAAAYGIYKLVQWWRRNEDGPTSGWGVGFGKGNAGLNLNPIDKGKAGTGDGGDGIGAKWERATVSGVQGWRRKGIPLPGEEGNPNTFQAAILIVSDDGSIPDIAKWPDTLPVFFVNDADAGYPEVDGGWLLDARFGTIELQHKYPNMIRNFACAATDSASLTKCIKQELEDTISIQWA